MMTTNACPKCNSANILHIPVKKGKMGKWNNSVIWLSAVKYVEITRLVCENCGYSEEWITNKENLKKLRDKYG